MTQTEFNALPVGALLYSSKLQLHYIILRNEAGRLLYDQIGTTHTYLPPHIPPPRTVEHIFYKDWKNWSDWHDLLVRVA